MYCIDHGFDLIDRFNLQLDEAGHQTVREFGEVRTQLLELFPYHDGADHSLHTPVGQKKTGIRINPEQVLVAEATATMQLGEDELREGMRKEAARNFHTATVYFRVLESLVPTLTRFSFLHTHTHITLITHSVRPEFAMCCWQQLRHCHSEVPHKSRHPSPPISIFSAHRVSPHSSVPLLQILSSQPSIEIDCGMGWMQRLLHPSHPAIDFN